ncbi:DUF1398 domain-containing protein [Pedobacter frigoris]|uniref:DUF1398 domain-containing protein n=1 Tax=Pedobacter frigoris TaxID=2571272 RepID=UPI002931D893|nr:DUF1398 family protein [Pedobacter frigoris]
MKFTVQQIEAAHDLVKTGADFPKYIQDIIKLGVKRFETFVNDSHTKYFGADAYETCSNPQYELLNISDRSNPDLFITYLKGHQRGASDYFTFCRQCAETGVEKWIVDLSDMTCIYYDKSGAEILVEQIPVP